MTLSTNQITLLTAAHNAALFDPTDNNIAAYYTILDGADIIYGSLAQGVVLNNTFAGILANNYAENKLVNDKGASFSALEQESLKVEIMNQDFLARGAVVFADITGQTISGYHDLSFSDVFTGVNGPEEAWTLYHIVRALNNYESWLADDMFAYVGLAKEMWLAYIAGDTSSRSHASMWLQDMSPSQFQMLDTSTGDLVYGDGVFTASFLEWLNGSGQQQHGSLYDSELAKFALGGAATDVPLVGAGIELAIAEHVAQSDGGSVPSPLFTTANGIQTTAATLLTNAGPGTDPVALQLIKAGIEYALTGDPDSLQAPPDGHTTDFELIDDFRAQSLIVQTSTTQVSAQGTADSDLFIGGAASSDFTGAAGDDLLYGGGGADGLDGGAGNDAAFGGAGADRLASTADEDVLDGGTGNDVIDLTGSGETGTVRLRPGSGYEVVVTRDVYRGGGSHYLYVPPYDDPPEVAHELRFSRGSTAARPSSCGTSSSTTRTGPAGATALLAGTPQLILPATWRTASRSARSWGLACRRAAQSTMVRNEASGEAVDSPRAG